MTFKSTFSTRMLLKRAKRGLRPLIKFTANSLLPKYLRFQSGENGAFISRRILNSIVIRFFSFYSDAGMRYVLSWCRENEEYYLSALFYRKLGYEHFECISLERSLNVRDYVVSGTDRAEVALRLIDLYARSLNFSRVEELIQIVSAFELTRFQTRRLIKSKSLSILHFSGFEAFENYIERQYKIYHDLELLKHLLLCAKRQYEPELVSRILDRFFCKDTKATFAVNEYLSLLENSEDNEGYLNYFDHALGNSQSVKEQSRLISSKIKRFVLLGRFQELTKFLKSLDIDLLQTKQIKRSTRDLLRKNLIEDAELSEVLSVSTNPLIVPDRLEQQKINIEAVLASKESETSFGTSALELFVTLIYRAFNVRRGKVQLGINRFFSVNTRSKYVTLSELLKKASVAFDDNQYSETLDYCFQFYRKSKVQNKDINTLFFYSYMALDRSRIPKFLKVAAKRRNHQFAKNITGVVGVGASLDWWATTACGNYGGAYDACQYTLFSRYLNQNFCGKRRFSFYQSYGRALIIACTGVADEFRAFKYFDALPFEHIEYTCDPRSLKLFSDSRSDIVYHPIYQIRAGSNKAEPREFLGNPWLTRTLTTELFERLDDFDLILTSVELHALFRSHFKSTLSSQYAGSNLVVKTTKPVTQLSPSIKKVGVVWRSNHVNVKRSRNYFDIEYLETFIEHSDNYQLVSLEPNMTVSEIEFCLENNIQIIDDVDLYDDFDSTAALLSSLDAVVGISTLISELASAVGTPTFYLCLSSEMFCVRKGGLEEVDPIQPVCDVIAVGQNTIGVSDYNRPKSEVVEELLINAQQALDRHFELPTD